MIIRTIFTITLFIGLMGFIVSETNAQEGDLAMLYEMEVKTGSGPEFEQALAEHARWRTEQGDPWAWEVYQVAVGDNLGTYYARAPERSWADFDAYDADFGPRAGDHFNQTVGPHIRSITNLITRIHSDAMRVPEEPVEFQIFSVYLYRIKAGMAQQFWGTVEQIHEAINQADHPVHYAFHSVAAGGSGMEVHLVTLHQNWADMEEPEPSLMQVVQNAYGEEEAAELFNRFSDTVSSIDNMVLRYRPDLSVNQ